MKIKEGYNAEDVMVRAPEFSSAAVLCLTVFLQDAWADSLRFLVVMGNLKITKNESYSGEVLVEWNMRSAEEIGYFMTQLKVLPPPIPFPGRTP